MITQFNPSAKKIAKPKNRSKEDVRKSKERSRRVLRAKIMSGGLKRNGTLKRGAREGKLLQLYL